MPVAFRNLRCATICAGVMFVVVLIVAVYHLSHGKKGSIFPPFLASVATEVDAQVRVLLRCPEAVRLQVHP